MNQSVYTNRIALTVALGGFLMGFDASVISGVNKFIQIEFNLTDLQLGFSVSSLTIVAALAMMISGPLSDKLGRKLVLKFCALIFTVSAVGSALASGFTSFLLFRMLGGLGVGASLIVAPMYIAEIAPASKRGRLVSFNQLNIVLGITIAFFTNYYILSLADSASGWVSAYGLVAHNWRWMLGIEALPAIVYFFALFSVPKSPRWLMSKGSENKATAVLQRFISVEETAEEIKAIKAALNNVNSSRKTPITELFKPA
ncbi:MAG: MFS transporter, partial [Schleiferiaceae bacterium]|nr:MFS transporter [Schleiferiaceae bacterium]